MKHKYKIDVTMLGDTPLYHVYELLDSTKPDTPANRRYKSAFLKDRAEAQEIISQLIASK